MAAPIARISTAVLKQGIVDSEACHSRNIMTDTAEVWLTGQKFSAADANFSKPKPGHCADLIAAACRLHDAAVAVERSRAAIVGAQNCYGRLNKFLRDKCAQVVMNDRSLGLALSRALTPRPDDLQLTGCRARKSRYLHMSDGIVF